MTQQELIPSEGRPEGAAVLSIISEAARNAAVDVDKLERLLAMHERIKAQEAKMAYAEALAALQSKLPMIRERGQIKNSAGKVQSTYAEWEDVVTEITPLLSAYGFSLSFRTGFDGAEIVVTGVLLHRAGHSESTSIRLPADTSGSKNAVQAIGSSTSYGQRYTARALLNLRTGQVDDDGRGGQSVEKLSDKQRADLEALISEVGADRARLFAYLKISSLDDIPAANFEAVCRTVAAKRKKQ